MNLFSALIVAAAATFTNMTPDEQKKTGVVKLGDQEKAALQEWIDAHYTKKTTAA